MSILVTGGLGLLGRQALELLAAADRKAVSYDRAAPSGDTVAGVEYVTGDLNDYPHLIETVRRHEVEAIIHTAAASGPMVRADAPDMAEEDLARRGVSRRRARARQGEAFRWRGGAVG